MTLFPLVWDDAPPQIQENRTHMTLDNGRRASEILEIPSFDSDRKKPLYTDTGYILSKK